MNIWESDKLILFIAFVIPGFISIKVYELFYPGTPKDSSKQIIDAIAYSSINYAILLVPIQLVENSSINSKCPTFYSIFYLFVLFVAPIIWVTAWKFIRNLKTFQKVAHHPTQKPWDYVFSKKEPYWVKVTLKDGSKIAGKYSVKSFASSAPAEEQIYLEETWLLNDKLGFERPKIRSAGVIILASEIAYVELTHYEEEST